MDVDARPNEIVRLWPKLPIAAAPEYVMDFMPTTPIAFDAASITAFASSAPAAVARDRTKTTAADARAFHMSRLHETIACGAGVWLASPGVGGRSCALASFSD